jgi:hypothetical protein
LKFRFLLPGLFVGGFFTAGLFIVVLFIAEPLHTQTHPIPPGVRQADQAEAQTEKNIPPPATARAAIDPAKLQHDAEELAALATTIPPDVGRAVKGILPRDLSAKLKRIEKLAKQLRSELDR